MTSAVVGVLASAVGGVLANNISAVVGVLANNIARVRPSEGTGLRRSLLARTPTTAKMTSMTSMTNESP